MKAKIAILGAILSSLIVTSALADINRVRVVNADKKYDVYVHKGGYASSVKIPPGQWHIFYYPFKVLPPGQKQEVTSSLLVATSGGRWITTDNGYTVLHNPRMVICLDYGSKAHKHKTGNRVWTIKRAEGFDRGCKLKPFKQANFKRN